MKTRIVEQRILTADEGMYLTDGDTYGKTVVLPADADHTIWQEISEEEKLQMEQAGATREYVAD